MPKFTLERVDIIKGKIKIYKLLIDDNCEFDAFCDSLEGKKGDSLIGSLFATLESFANIQMLPGTRFKELSRPKADTVKDYEIKIAKYRIYLFKDSIGGIVVLGGSKNNQSKDIKRLRSIKREYIKETTK